MKKIDEKLNRVYDYISKFVQENGYPPTVREICHDLKINSTATAFSYIERLEQQGRITRGKNKDRAIGLTENIATFSASVMIPLVGTVSAGAGILAAENIEGTMPFPKELFGSDQMFLLRVSGDSMIEVGIDDGDFVVVRKQDHAPEHSIVVALLEENATVKRFYVERGRVILHPENSALRDIVVDEKASFRILGRVVGCIKRF